MGKDSPDGAVTQSPNVKEALIFTGDAVAVIERECGSFSQLGLSDSNQVEAASRISESVCASEAFTTFDSTNNKPQAMPSDVFFNCIM